MSNSTAICSDCADNVHLKRRIIKDGWPQLCSICVQEKPHVFDVAHLAGVLATIIQQNFGTGDTRFVLRNDDRDHTEPCGDTLETIVSEILNQDLYFLDELVVAIVESEDCRPQDGDECFFGNDAQYSRNHESVSLEYFDDHWNYLIGELKHKRRFFSEAVQQFFNGIFAGIETIKTFGTNGQTLENVVRGMAQGMVVYRARVIDVNGIEDIMADPYSQVGPPPRQKARAGRMSPDGVVVLYCAMQSETAIAELRPAIGETVAVVGLAFNQSLRLLDFERLERSFDDNWSLLQEDFRTARETRQFLRKLHKLITKPIVPGHEADYIITQTMAEYLAHVHKPEIDGIMFKSAQNAGGTNVVLFPVRDLLEVDKDVFPVEYAPNSLLFHRVEGVQYSSNRLEIIPKDKGGYDLYTARDLRDAEDAYNAERELNFPDVFKARAEMSSDDDS
ncbi:RES family NAD+ phosphorylase [Undibacterium terreum]|nr:RES family NAD+ phosphorylase [Undibacterium terreum]